MALRIEDYALIGDTQTAALVGKNGSIDWFCAPRFDSGACFAALLGDAAQGRWLIAPRGEVKKVSRRYERDSLVLVTEFCTEEGIVEVRDCMPPRDKTPDIVRTVTGVSGRVAMEMDLVIRFEYGSVVPWVAQEGGILRAIAGPDSLSLWCDVETKGRNLTTIASFEVAARAGDSVPAGMVTVARGASAAARLRCGGERHRRLVARMGQPEHVRGSLARAGDTLADHTEGADL